MGQSDLKPLRIILLIVLTYIAIYFNGLGYIWNMVADIWNMAAELAESKYINEITFIFAIISFLIIILIFFLRVYENYNINVERMIEIGKQVESRQNHKIRILLTSFVVYFIYGFSLSLLSSIIIYLVTYTLDFSIKWYITALLIYYISEAILLFYDKPVGPIKEKSFPTPAIMSMALVVFIYCKITRRAELSIMGILAFIRFNITNPAWLYINMADYDNGKGLIKGGGGRTLSEVSENRSITQKRFGVPAKLEPKL